MFDEDGSQIGKLECYYGNRTSLGNRYPSNQPYMQRWIVDRTALEQKLLQVENPNLLKEVVDVVIREYDIFCVSVTVLLIRLLHHLPVNLRRFI